MRLAAIDIGSNSIHMIIANVDADGTIKVIDRIKQMARLGEKTLAAGYLGESAQERGLNAIRDFKRLANAYKVDDIVAVATSAIRESRNGAEFIKRIYDTYSIKVRIIDGVEEGHYIYLGAREVYDFGSRRALLVDIGGGSVELIVADRLRPYEINSLQLGVRRLRDAYPMSVRPSAQEIESLRAHIRAYLEEVSDSVNRRNFEHVLATSGTALTLARLTRSHLHQRVEAGQVFVPVEDLSHFIDFLVGADSKLRSKIGGVEERRLETLLHGAVLLETIVKFFGQPGFTVCDGALREGMIVDYLEKNRAGMALREEVPDPRRRSIMVLSRRMSDAHAHALNVSRHALSLFDGLRSLHGLNDEERELLEFAALTHSCGRIINQYSHHKHALYILQHAELSGFTQRERDVIANVVRYHRRSAPKSKHAAYMALAREDRKVVKKLSAILRVANALDRGRQGNVDSIEIRLTSEMVYVFAHAQTDIGLEIKKVNEQAEYFEKVFGVAIRVISARRLLSAGDGALKGQPA